MQQAKAVSSKLGELVGGVAQLRAEVVIKPQPATSLVHLDLRAGLVIDIQSLEAMGKEHLLPQPPRDLV